MPTSSPETAVQFELLQLSLKNAARSVPALVVVVGYIVVAGAQVDARAATLACAALGAVAAVWRLALIRGLLQRGSRDSARFAASRRALEGNALLAGLMWTVASLAIFPQLEGAMATGYVVMACGSIAVAAQFMSLVGRSFEWLAGPQLVSLTLAMLMDDPAGHWPLALLTVVFAATMFRYASDFRVMATSAVRRGFEADAANASLRRAMEAAEQANRAKSAFLATVSHEIRTPMNGVIGMAEVLANDDSAAIRGDAVRTIRESAFALLGLIDDILDFSKIEAGRMTLEQTPLDLRALVRGVCDALAPVAEGKGVDLTVEVATALPARVLSDPTRLRQLLNNLVGNAIKFSATRGSCRGRVGVRVEPAAPGFLRIEIADNGIGMNAATLERLFTPFMQAESSTQRRFGGTGLGLAICQRITELMGGRIGVTSQPGTGSTFTVTLPFETAAPMAPELPVPAPQCAAASGAMPILVAEDDATNQKVIARQLALLGHSADIAATGSEALRRWRSGRYGLLLTDLHMPEMDGYALAAAIRTEEQSDGRPRLPIVALTATALAGEAERALAAGMDDYLTKPLLLPHLKAALERRFVPPAAAAPAAPGVDLGVLRELVGADDALLRDFLMTYRESAREAAHALRGALAQGNAGEASAIAHRLKSSSRTIGALGLGQLCDDIERDAGRDAAGPPLQRFEAEFALVEADIEHALAA